MYEIITVPTALSLLAWASIQDLKKREVRDITWLPMIVLGGILLFFRNWSYGTAVFFLMLVLLILALASFTTWLGGGGDIKGLLAILILFPEKFLIIVFASAIALLTFGVCSFLAGRRDIFKQKVPFIPFLLVAFVIAFI